ncbi:MAG: glycosyltransferase family 2 protein [Rhodospirillaceae bacterium]|nr:glycosyltransferase family 2 protein [Rhodospirillaceae bacterium]
MADLDAVIVNYRSAALTGACVEALHRARAADGVAATITVVNNSDDGAELTDTVDRAGGATMIQNAANLGFGTACNAGAARGSADVLLFLNPDAAVSPGCLRACLEFLSNPAHADIGILGPQLRDATGEIALSCARSPTFGDLVWQTLGLHLLIPGTGFPYLPRATHLRSGDVGQVMGAVLFIRRRVFAQLRGFDERFFLYYEDVDLCARAAAAGWRSHLLVVAQATHIGAGSSATAAGRSLGLHAVSRAAYARKHFGGAAGLIITLLSLVVEFPLRAARAMAKGAPVGPVLEAWGLAAKSALGAR